MRQHHSDGKAIESYATYDEIPNDSYHGKKFSQKKKFLKYRNNKLNKGNFRKIYDLFLEKTIFFGKKFLVGRYYF